jgi:predicted nicotinamide N-methyase
VLELGSGYGLAGFAIAACTDASEVIISDGNPQVVNCILFNIHHYKYNCYYALTFILIYCKSELSCSSVVIL